MPKKEEFKKIVRGKGMDALRPSAENLSSEKKIIEEPISGSPIRSSVDNSEEATRTFSAETVSEQQVLEKFFVISEIVPSQEEQDYIQDLLGEDANQIVIWDTFISQGEKRGLVLKKNEPIIFNVCCAASGLLAQLKPELEIHWITHDIQRMQVQPLYEFKIRTKPLWPVFIICYEIQPALAGYFKYSIIVDVEPADLFWVREGIEFKIH